MDKMKLIKYELNKKCRRDPSFLLAYSTKRILPICLHRALDYAY